MKPTNFIIISDARYWQRTENQRKFFIEFATQKGFNPLVPENWDKITIEDMNKQVRKKYMAQSYTSHCLAICNPGNEIISINRLL